MKSSGKVGNGPINKWLNFGGDPDHHLDTGIVFWIRHYWEIWKVVNRHKSAARTDLPDGGTGKMCLGTGMYCPSASSLNFISYLFIFSSHLLLLFVLLGSICSAFMACMKHSISYVTGGISQTCQAMKSIHGFIPVLGLISVDTKTTPYLQYHLIPSTRYWYRSFPVH